MTDVSRSRKISAAVPEPPSRQVTLTADLKNRLVLGWRGFAATGGGSYGYTDDYYEREHTARGCRQPPLGDPLQPAFDRSAFVVPSLPRMTFTDSWTYCT